MLLNYIGLQLYRLGINRSINRSLILKFEAIATSVDASLFTALPSDTESVLCYFERLMPDASNKLEKKLS